jgi:3-phosphoglycerate kinase
VVVWVIHIIYGDQAKDSLFISSGLVNISDNIFLAGIKFVAFGFAQGKGMKHRLFHFTGYEVCRED